MESPLTVLLQPKGLLHRFIRHKDASTIVERPERLRAVAVGTAAAVARLQEHNTPSLRIGTQSYDPSDELTAALDRLALTPKSAPCQILTTTSTANILTSDAAKFIHGEPQEYLSKLSSWALSSEDKIRTGESEIPTGYSQGDLYCMQQHNNEKAPGLIGLLQCANRV